MRARPACVTRRGEHPKPAPCCVYIDTVATYLGHANIAVTFDRYGHLFPGSEHARGLLDTYLEAA